MADGGELFGADFWRGFLGLDIPFVERLERGKAELILRMMDQRVNSPLTSSCGRLFDAVAALIGIRHEVSYEAQAAMELEMSGRSSHATDGYPLDIRRQNGRWQIDSSALFRAIVEDLRRKVSRKQSVGDSTTGWSRLS